MCIMAMEKLTHVPDDAAEAAQNIFGVDFGNRPLATVAIVAATGGAALVWANRKRMLQAAEPDVVNFSNPSMEEAAPTPFRRHRIFAAALGVLAFTGASAHLADQAEPHTTESRNLVDSVAVVVDSSWQAKALDVTDDGAEEPITRFEASTHGVLQLQYEGLTDVDMAVIAAGKEAEHMGMTNDRSEFDEFVEVIDELKDYINTEANTASADLSGALRQRDVSEADMVLMFTSSVDSVSSELGREENIDRVNVIAVGVDGTPVGASGREATIDHTGIEESVGADNSYTATSVEGVKEVVDSLISEQIVETEVTPYEGFGKLRNLALFSLALGVAAKTARGAASFIRSKSKREEEQ